MRSDPVNHLRKELAGVFAKWRAGMIDIGAAPEDLDAALASLSADKAESRQPGRWVRCTPTLLSAGVSCEHTPRRPGEGHSHDHFIAHFAPPSPESRVCSACGLPPIESGKAPLESCACARLTFTDPQQASSSVGRETKMLARDVHYAIHEAGLAPESPVEDAAFRDAILGVLAQQIETVDEAWRTGFVAGAKWWEWEKSGATMWQADQERAYQAALEKRARQSQGDGGDQKLP